MKFDSIEALIRHIFSLNVPIQNVNFEIGVEDATNGSCTTDSVCATEPQLDQPSTVKVAFNSFSDKPVIEFERADASVLVVEEFDVIPNSCTTTKVKIADREILIGVCEETDGTAVAKFDVMVNGKLYTNKKFILTADGKNYKNTISIDD